MLTETQAQPQCDFAKAKTRPRSHNTDAPALASHVFYMGGGGLPITPIFSAAALSKVAAEARGHEAGSAHQLSRKGTTLSTRRQLNDGQRR